MSDPTRWSEGTPPADPVENRLSKMLRDAVDVGPWDEVAQARMRKHLEWALEDDPSGPRLGARSYAVGAAVLVPTLVSLLAMTLHFRSSDSASHLSSSPGSRVQLARALSSSEGERLDVSGGLVDVRGADPAHRVSLRTPHLTAIVQAASFLVEVAGDHTMLVVIDGEAWVGEVVRAHLVGGQSIRSDEARLHPTLPATPVPRPSSPSPSVGSVPQVVAPCASQSSAAAKHDCYLNLAMGNDLAAQNALFQLGVSESEEAHDGPSAIVSWRAYQKRFPQGSLGPEAAYSILSEFLTEHRAAEALNEATLFLAHYPSDPRGDEVRLATASLACAVGAQANAALTLLAAPLSHPGVPGRGEALFVTATCNDRLGHPAEARKADRTYLEEFPNGPHAPQVRGRLSP